MFKPIRKSSIKDLHIQDFLSNPIWSFVEEDGDEVETVDYPDNLVLPIGGGVLFVLCEYQFNDETRLNGVVFIRRLDQGFYMLAFPRHNGSLFEYSVHPLLSGTAIPEQIANHLNKSIEETFPIRFNTPFFFENGKKLEGVYKLP